jgi:hypothetical protein
MQIPIHNSIPLLSFRGQVLHLKRTDVREITINHIQDALDDNDQLFSFLTLPLLVGVSLQGPCWGKLLIAVFLDILRNGSCFGKTMYRQ